MKSIKIFGTRKLHFLCPEITEQFRSMPERKPAKSFFPSMAIKKAQVKIQEMAFVLLALVLLASMAFVFFIGLQKGNISDESDRMKQSSTMSLLNRIANLPELNCQANKICLDEDKIGLLGRNSKSMDNLFQGLKKVEAVRIYPGAGTRLLIYSSGSEGNQSYSTYVNLCKQESDGYNFQWNCGLALLKLQY